MKKRINVFYVWGYNSSPESTTRKYLQELLGKNYNVISDYYAQYNPVEAVKDIEYYVKEYDVDILVGSSLGGFIVLQTETNIPKIIINPCLYPNIELPKLVNTENEPIVPEHIVDFYTSFVNDNNIWGKFNNENTTFILGSDDEVLGTKYVDEIKSYSENVHIVAQGHKNTKESLKEYVVPIIKTL